MVAKSILALAICTLVIVVYAEEELYSDKYDYIDVNGILKNDRLRSQYYACFLDTAPCLTADAKFFKDKIAEALVTKCRKCTDKQRYMFEQVVTYYIEKEPEQWLSLVARAFRKFEKKKL